MQNWFFEFYSLQPKGERASNIEQLFASPKTIKEESAIYFYHLTFHLITNNTFLENFYYSVVLLCCKSMKMNDSERWRHDDCELMWNQMRLWEFFFFGGEEQKLMNVDGVHQSISLEKFRDVKFDDKSWICARGMRKSMCMRMRLLRGGKSMMKMRISWISEGGERGFGREANWTNHTLRWARVTRTIADIWLVGFHAHNYRWAKSYFNWESPSPILALAKYTTLGYTTWNTRYIRLFRIDRPTGYRFTRLRVSYFRPVF